MKERNFILETDNVEELNFDMDKFAKDFIKFDKEGFPLVKETGEFSALSDRHYTAIYNSISDGQSPTSRFSKATGEEILKRVERNKVYVADRARHKGISDAKGNIDEAATVRNYRDEMKKLSAIEEYVKKKLKRK